MALDKSNSDDQLLDALRAEIAKLQSKLKAAGDESTYGNTRRNLNGSMTAPGRTYNPMDRIAADEWQAKEQQYQSELHRLQRLCKNQVRALCIFSLIFC